jgi:hypothetical protein
MVNLGSTERQISRETVFATLDRHSDRRGRGVPTVSVLIGPQVRAVHLIAAWAETIVRPVVLVQIDDPDLKSVVSAWIDAIAFHHDLGAVAIEWLARRLERTAGSLGQSLHLMTSHEIATFLEAVLPLETETQVERVARFLIEHTIEDRLRPTGQGLPSTLDSALEGFGRPWLRVFRAVSEIVPANHSPVFVMRSGMQNVTGLEETARILTEMATAQPRTALNWLVEPMQFASYNRQAPPSRVKALLHESIISLTGPSLPTVASPRATAIESSESTSVSYLREDQRSDTCDLEFENARPGDDDQARSAAERFLFDRLEAMIETAGLFELNATLDFHFGGNRLIEVDLVARSLKLAVEIDGYHHFTDPERFRRDRRKDLELQKQGYLVVRVLADDVVDRLEDVMDTILQAVAFRRAAAMSRGATS